MRVILFILSIFPLLVLIPTTHQQIDWLDYDLNTDDDADQYLPTFTRGEEEEVDVFSPIITGFKYMSGGAGEGRQHLSPDGEIPNHQEVKTDEELPRFCDPPNPCPLGVEADDCDSSIMSDFTPQYSQWYQNQQDCPCDSDHDQCGAKSEKNQLKRSRRNRPGFASNQAMTYNSMRSNPRTLEDALW